MTLRDTLFAAYVRLRDEPVLTAALVAAVLGLLVQFGLPLPDEAANSLTVVIFAVSAWLARRKVVPATKVDALG